MSDDFEIVKRNEETGAWMLTFADLVSLIITFFVMLYSMSQIKNETWEKVNKSFTTRFNPDAQHQETTSKAEKTVPRIIVPDAQDIGYLKTLIDSRIKDYPWQNEVEIELLADRIIVSLAGDAGFAPASAVLTQKAAEIIASFAMIIGNVGNNIDIYGNADPSLSTTKSNWQLSLERAQAVAEKLRENGYANAITAIGRSSSAYEQEKTSEDKNQRFRNARRIDIVIGTKSAAITN